MASLKEERTRHLLTVGQYAQMLYDMTGTDFEDMHDEELQIAHYCIMQLARSRGLFQLFSTTEI